MWRHIRDRWRFTVTTWKKVGIWQCEWLPFSQEKRLKHKMTFLWVEEIVTHNLNNIPCLRVSSWQACLTNFKRATLAISTIKSSTCIMLCVTHVCSQLDFSHASDNSRVTFWDMQCGVFHHHGVYLRSCHVTWSLRAVKEPSKHLCKAAAGISGPLFLQ